MVGVMTMMVVDSGVGGAEALLRRVDGRFEGVDAELSTRSDDEIVGLVTELEMLDRRLGALQLAVMDEIEGRGLHHGDGHISPKVMVRHLGRLSPSEAAGREKARQMLRRLPAVWEAYVSGDVGTDQVRLLGRVHSNRRVAPHMADRAEKFVRDASRSSFPDFEQELRLWERLVDQDGAEPAVERSHDRRDFTMVQDHFGLGWEIRGGIGSLSGAAMDEIFQKYVQAEWEADWEKARADKGDEATVDDLARTPSQRRADALWQIFQDAASTPPDSNAPRFVHTIVWTPPATNRCWPSSTSTPPPLDVDTFRRETIDGIPLAPTEAIVNGLVGEFRRVIVDAAGTVIDLGTTRRFTGSSRLAAQLQATRCPWTGCLVRTSRCEIDHTHPHSDGGRTNPGNGAPLCGRHNDGNKKASPSGATPPEPGTHTAPTAPKSTDRTESRIGRYATPLPGPSGVHPSPRSVLSKTGLEAAKLEVGRQQVPDNTVSGKGPSASHRPSRRRNWSNPWSTS